MDAPIYFFSGPELGECEQAIKSVKDSLKKKFGQIEEYLYYAAETTAQEILTVLQNESLFSSCCCVVVKNAELIKKKDDVDQIVKWASNCAADSNVLILVTETYSIDSKILKEVPASHKKTFWEMSPEQKNLWVKKFFAEKKYKISKDAVCAILDLVENNTLVLGSECSRFFSCFSSEHQITEDDVFAVLAHNREENAFTLFNQMADFSLEPQKCLEKSLEILQKIRLSKENSSVMIIAGLTSCFRKLSVWFKLKAEGKLDDFNLKINGISSKKQKNQYSSASRVWTLGQVTAILAILASTDMEIRSSGTTLEDIFLQKLVYEIVVKKGASSASYDFKGLR